MSQLLNERDKQEFAIIAKKAEPLLSDEQKQYLHEYASLFVKLEKIKAQNNTVIIGIDGSCGSGKTTLANLLKSVYNCNVIHTDHFFLPPEKRTHERLNEAGGNIDYERFVKDVITPLKSGTAFEYKPFNCQTCSLGQNIVVKKQDINVIEGSYSMHPLFAHIYNLRVFLSINYDEQLRRIKLRNGEEWLKEFEQKWIPMENKYFECFSIKNRCDIIFTS